MRRVLGAALSRSARVSLGEALPNSECVGRLAARFGLDAPCLYESGEERIRAALASRPPLPGQATALREQWGPPPHPFELLNAGQRPQWGIA